MDRSERGNERGIGATEGSEEWIGAREETMDGLERERKTRKRKTRDWS